MRTGGRYWIGVPGAIVPAAADGTTAACAPSGSAAVPGTASHPVRLPARALALARAGAPGATGA